MKKVIFYSAIVILGALVGYFIYTIFFAKQQHFLLHFTILPSDDSQKIEPNINFEKLLEFDYIDNYQFIFSDGISTYSKDIDLKGIHQAYRLKILNDTFLYSYKTFLKKTKRNNFDPNQAIFSLVENLSNNLSKSDLIHQYYLIGSFPNCYQIKDAENCIARIDKLLQKDTLWKQFEIEERKKINWNLNSNAEEPEELIYNFLLERQLIKSKDLKITPKRKCLYNDTIIITIFEKIDEANSKKIVSNLKKTFGNQFVCIILSQQNLGGIQFEFNDDDISNFVNYISSVPKIKWEHLQHLFEKAADLFNKEKNNLVFIGNLPETTGKAIKTKAYEKLSKSNINWYFNNKNQINLNTNQFIEYFQKNFNVTIYVN